MKKILIIAAIAAIPLAGFAYWAISPLFNNITAHDSLPGTSKQVPSEQVPSTNSATLETVPATPVPPSTGKSGMVIGTIGHPASGTARIVEAAGKQYVRYENFKTINGPDIYVYLAKDTGAKEFINLGKVKATEGEINYEIPAGVNAADYPYVLTWCKTFSVLFNSAELK